MEKVITPFTLQTNIDYPIILGPMYPCSNPELVAAVSLAGGIGVVQPLSLTYVHGYSFKEGLALIQSLSKGKPFGLNLLLENSSKVYEKKMAQWIEIALEMGCRFFITSLGNPKRVVKRVACCQGIVYHDATEKKWAEKALESGVHGLILVNNRAGGHAGKKSQESLFEELKVHKVPLIAAGGIASPSEFVAALKLGYAGVQMGTRFIATEECKEQLCYKQAIIKATENDIVLTERVTGIPLSVICTPYVEKIGTQVNPLTRWLLKQKWSKRWIRLAYQLLALKRFKDFSLSKGSSKDYWQAGKSVSSIHSIEKAGTIVQKLASAAKQAGF